MEDLPGVLMEKRISLFCLLDCRISTYYVKIIYRDLFTDAICDRQIIESIIGFHERGEHRLWDMILLL